MCGVDLYVIDNPGMHSQGLLSRHSFNTVEALSFAGCRDVWFTVNSIDDCVYAVCQPNAWEQFLKRPSN